MALPQLPAYVVHKLGQHSRVIQEFLSTENMQKRAVLSGRLSFVHTVYPIFKVHSTDFFSNIFFLSKAAYAWGRNSCVRFAFFIMSRLPKHSCVLRSQHLLSQMHSLSITPELYSGTFSRKSTFLKIFLLIYPSYTLPSSAERRAGDDRANADSTPRQQKVLFVNICHRHWLFSARGFPREISSPLNLKL